MSDCFPSIPTTWSLQKVYQSCINILISHERFHLWNTDLYCTESVLLENTPLVKFVQIYIHRAVTKDCNLNTCYGWVRLRSLWCYGWTCVLLTQFTHKVTSLLWVWRTWQVQVTENSMAPPWVGELLFWASTVARVEQLYYFAILTIPSMLTRGLSL